MNRSSSAKRHLPHFLIATFAPLLLFASGASLAGVCDGFYPAGFELTEGKPHSPMIPRPKPAKGAVTWEPNFNTCLFRATDHRSEPSSFYVRNDYSRRQAFNANSTYFITYTNNGSWSLYDANTLQRLRTLTPLAGDAEPQWHPTNPNVLYYLPTNGGTKLLKMDVRNNQSSTVVDFAGKLPSWAATAAHMWTRSEGSPSANGRYWGFLVYDEDWDMLGYVVWDLQQNRLVGSRKASDPLDHASMSASGRWFVVSGWDGVWAWSADFSRKKKIEGGPGQHSDLAIGPNGNDYFVSVDYESNDGDVYFVDVDSCPSVSASATSAPECPHTVLFSMYPGGSWAAMHFSGKAFDKPGWALISTYATGSKNGTVPWFDNKVFAIELKASPKIYPLAYTHRVVPDEEYGETGANRYWTEPHATVNRDFTRINFNSNWGNSDGADVDVYTIKLPVNALSGAVPSPEPPDTSAPPMSDPLPPSAVVGGTASSVPTSSSPAGVGSAGATPISPTSAKPAVQTATGIVGEQLRLISRWVAAGLLRLQQVVTTWLDNGRDNEKMRAPRSNDSPTASVQAPSPALRGITKVGLTSNAVDADPAAVTRSGTRAVSASVIRGAQARRQTLSMQVTLHPYMRTGLRTPGIRLMKLYATPLN